MQKRIKRPDTRYAVAIQDSFEGRPRVLGYVAFLIPSNAEDETDKIKLETSSEAQKFPKTLDVEAYKYATEVMVKAKKEILGEHEKNTWCMLMTSTFSNYQLKFLLSLTSIDLGSLAVDTDYNRKGVASNSVQWRLEEAKNAGLP